MISRLLLSSVVAIAAVQAASTTAWELNSYQDFLRGKFSGLSLTREGRITLSPRVETLFASEQPAIWTVVQGPDGSLFAGSGHRGRVYRVDPSGKGALLWTAPQPEIFALAIGPDKALYVGTSPDGKVYRLQDGNAQEYFAPGAKYIWSLAFAPDGALYVGTGDQGKIFRVQGGKGEVYYETGQSHITCLTVDANGQLLAGSEPNGLIYRVSAKDKAFVLYDAGLAEIRTLVTAPDGSVYAAALGGSLAQRNAQSGAAAAAGATVGAVTAAPMVITVTDDSAAAQAGLAQPKPQTDAPKPAPAAPAFTPTVDISGGEKSAVYRILPDNTVETLWTSAEENVYDMLLGANGLVFSTDTSGRIYRLNNDRKLTLIAQTNEGEATRLAALNDVLVAASGSGGKLFRLGSSSAAAGFYESPVHDAGSVARWGQLSWRGERRGSSRLAFRTRSGNSARPDRTWSEWSEPLSDPGGSAVNSPNARFIQWKAEFESANDGSPSLTGVSLAYLPQNTAPVVKQLSVTTQMGAANLMKAALPQTPSTTTYSITVTDTGEAPASSAGTPTQSMSRTVTPQIVVNWTAEDADGDRLLYALYFRGEEEQQWKLLKSNFAETTLTLEGDVFADGKYFFRVVATDRSSNPGTAAREAELVSSPVLFDATPPVLTVAPVRRNGERVEIDIDAVDSASGLRRAEFSLDAGSWTPLEPADGIVDGRREKFVLRFGSLPAGEHLTVFRVYDSAGNAGLAKVVVR